MPGVLLTGVSMRAAAQSAVKAGYLTHTIDAFADLDLPRGKKKMARVNADGRFDASGVSQDARDVAADAVVYGSGFEDDSNSVDQLSQGRALWGNPPDVLKQVRSPRRLLEGLAAQGFLVPRIFEPGGDAPTPGRIPWLEKPFCSGGGRGIRPWNGSEISSGCYLEEFIEGSPGSIVFVARAGHAVALGVSRQLAGDTAFGATGFQYCGSILSHPANLFERGVSVAATAHAVAMAVARDYALVGLNNVDFIARRGVAYPLEVNPRWSASVELIERAHGFSMFGLHADACARGTLPDDRLPLCLRRAVGKAIVFARSDLVVGRTAEWLSQPDVADVPVPGSYIWRGQPICTIFAEGDDPAACYRALVGRAHQVYDEVRRWREPVFPWVFYQQLLNAIERL
jgi:predicted ATP-grasp superfamily ATP-dependent carboligase